MLREKLDLVIHIGDYIFDGIGREQQVRLHVGLDLMTQDDCRNRQMQNRSRAPGHARRRALASLHPTAEEAGITCVFKDAAAKVRNLNFKYLVEGKSATVTARFGEDGITNCDANRAGEGAGKVFRRIYEKAI